MRRLDEDSEPAGTPAGATVAVKAERLFNEQRLSVYRRRDRVFSWLMLAQWASGILLAIVCSPYAWAGKTHAIHAHVWYAVVLGGALSVPIIVLARLRPAAALTRHAIAVAQMLWSALLIHLTGGRIETHFHVFGSLAFLAFYRDWKVLITATVVVAGDHLVRGLLLPESVYGIVNPEWWRFLEHAFWVVFEDIVLVMGIVENVREMKTLAGRQADLEEANATVEERVALRTRDLAASREQYRTLIESTKAIPCEMEASSLRFAYVGPQAPRLLGYAAETWLRPGFFGDRLHADDRGKTLEHFGQVGELDVDKDMEFRMVRDDGEVAWVRSIVSKSEDGSKLRGMLFDVTERRQIEFELHQAQKLESVGRLAAGIAHEINTPIQFVNDSIHFVRDAVRDLSGLIDKMRVVRDSVLSGAPSASAAKEAVAAEEDADLPYLVENLPKALDRSLDGLDRVATIVRSMKEFAYPDQKEMASVDLNQAIRSTLTIARNEYKYVADLEADLGEIPSVTCLAGDVNQAVLNIVVNAAHAIGDVVKGTDRKGRITVRTRVDGDFVVISIQDTGTGIPEGIRDRIFDPFFTTKEVGRGTGQGLAIARSVVVEKHGGELTFQSELGKGTTFFIRLPVQGAEQKALEGAAT